MTVHRLYHTIPSRTDDPETSHMAEREVRIRAHSQRAVMLAAFSSLGFTGGTDEEAAYVAGVNMRSCWWKRCSELREGGYTESRTYPNGDLVVRPGDAGVPRMVSTITAKGYETLRSLH